MKDLKDSQQMFNVIMFANTIIADPMGIGVEGKMHMFREIVRNIDEMVDANPPSEVPVSEIGTFKNGLVLQTLLDAVAKRAKNGQSALDEAEMNFAELAKGCPELRGMLVEYLEYYSASNKMFEEIENSEEIAQVKRLVALAL